MFYRVYIFIIATVIMCLGCEEDGVEWKPCEVMDSEYEVRQLYIGSNCSDVEWSISYEAVDRMNEMSRSLICGDIVEIVGEAEVDGSEIRDKDAMTCFYEEPEWYAGSRYDGKYGWAGYTKSGRYMFLFLFRKPLAAMDYKLSLIMHELFHYIGIVKHSDGENNISSGDGVDPRNTEYTRADAKHFCSVFNCIGEGEKK